MIYEYKCPKCGKTFERFRPHTECKLGAACECGENASRIMSRGITVMAAGVSGRIGKNGSWCDSLPGDPVFVKNKAHYKELVKQASENIGMPMHTVGMD